MVATAAKAKAESEVRGRELVVKVGGVWRLGEDVPGWEATAQDREVERVRVEEEGLERWDSSLLLFLLQARRWCEENDIPLDDSALPANVRELVSRIGSKKRGTATEGGRTSFLGTLDRWGRRLGRGAGSAIEFVGESVLSLFRILRSPRRFRFRDCLGQMYATGAAALPIVGLVSFLVGVIVGFQSAIQLRQFGADIYMVSLVGLSVVREMGPMMAAVVLAGRTGAAFAAHLGNMVVGEEVDALRSLGISPIDFLVTPRLVALVAMMPLLALYADLLGVAGGLSVASLSLHIQPATYWEEIRRVVKLSDLNAGLIKSVFFALLIGLAGCQRGLAAERTSSGVGQAATSAVVAGILLIVLSDALFGKLFEIMGI